MSGGNLPYHTESDTEFKISLFHTLAIPKNKDPGPREPNRTSQSDSLQQQLHERVLLYLFLLHILRCFFQYF